MNESLPLQSVAEFKHNAVWVALVDEIVGKLDRYGKDALKDFAFVDDPSALAIIQGEAKALEFVRRWPEIFSSRQKDSDESNKT